MRFLPHVRAQNVLFRARAAQKACILHMQSSGDDRRCSDIDDVVQRAWKTRQKTVPRSICLEADA